MCVCVCVCVCVCTCVSVCVCIQSLQANNEKRNYHGESTAMKKNEV